MNYFLAYRIVKNVSAPFRTKRLESQRSGGPTSGPAPGAPISTGGVSHPYALPAPRLHSGPFAHPGAPVTLLSFATAPQPPNLVPGNWVFGAPFRPRPQRRPRHCPLSSGQVWVPALQPGSATSVRLRSALLPAGASPVETGHPQSLLGVLSPRISAFQPHRPCLVSPTQAAAPQHLWPPWTSLPPS